MPRTKKTTCTLADPAPLARQPSFATAAEESPVQEQESEEEAQECVSDSEEGSWQDSGDEDMKDTYTAKDKATKEKADADAKNADDTLSDDSRENSPPAKRART